jgi:hypothetical protein
VVRVSRIIYIDPNEVIASSDTYTRDVEYQKELLNRQGQIVPLVCKQIDGKWHADDSDWPYASAQVIAARLLEWPTIIITDDPGED